MKLLAVERNGIYRSHDLPCTISISCPNLKHSLPKACLQVSNAFTAIVTTISNAYRTHLEARLSKCLAGQTPYRYIDPNAITPEFIEHLTKGRVIFAGYAANNIPTLSTLPESVLQAIRWVYFTRTNISPIHSTNTHGENLWIRPRLHFDPNFYYLLPGLKPFMPDIISKRLPNLQKISMGMLKIDNNNLISPKPDALLWMFCKFSSGDVNSFEIVYENDESTWMECRDGSVRSLDDVGFSCVDWEPLARSKGAYTSFIGADTSYFWIPSYRLGPRFIAGTRMYGILLKMMKLKDKELVKRGRYVRNWDPKGERERESLEEAVVWRVHNAEAELENKVVEMLFMEPRKVSGMNGQAMPAYTCWCRDCGGRSPGGF
ncbi:hypothetical protein TWF281_000275 [Arthrobotrys megalospora]